MINSSETTSCYYLSDDIFYYYYRYKPSNVKNHFSDLYININWTSVEYYKIYIAITNYISFFKIMLCSIKMFIFIKLLTVFTRIC